MEAVESTFAVAVAWPKLILEITGAAFVGVGSLGALARLVRTLAAPGAARFTPVRLQKDVVENRAARPAMRAS